MNISDLAVRGVILCAFFSSSALAAPQSIEDAQKALAATEAENQRRLSISEQNLKDATAAAAIAAARADMGLVSNRTSSGPATTDNAARLAGSALPDPSASPPLSPSAVDKANAETVLNLKKAAEEANASEKFGNITFGGGLSLTFDIGHTERISDAEIVKGIVYSKDKNDTVARFMLESHFFFKPRTPFLGVKSDFWGWGPFVAIQPGEDKIIDAMGLGLMIGFRKEEGKTDSFNIGLGMVIDPNTKVLSKGFVDGQPAPADETEVRFRETSQIGAMVLVSFSF